jgi:hypothetical protein
LTLAQNHPLAGEQSSDFLRNQFVRGVCFHSSFIATIYTPNTVHLQNSGNGRSPETLRVAYPREQEVLEFVSRGLINKQIAAKMNMREPTVKLNRGQMMRKMGRNRWPTRSEWRRSYARPKNGSLTSHESILALGHRYRFTMPARPIKARISRFSFVCINGGAIIDHKAPRERRFVAVQK